MSLFKTFMQWWPWIAAPIFWSGALLQAIEIIRDGGGSVSVANWYMVSGNLLGFAVFYTLHMERGIARSNGQLVSLISAAVYATVGTLAWVL